MSSLIYYYAYGFFYVKINWLNFNNKKQKQGEYFMNMTFDFTIPSKILFGQNTLSRLHTEKLPGKKAMLVISSGKSVHKYGYLSAVENELKQAGVEYEIYDKILANPILEHVTEAAAIAREKACDFVVGLGGGSVLDAAKAIALMATNEGNLWDYMGGTGKGQYPKVAPLPFVAITTTAGTGTEADPWYVITNENTNEKIGSGYFEYTFPVLSIVDPTLMLSVPPSFTAYQGFDALFHSAESCINKNNNPINEALALGAISLVAKYLPTAIKDGSDIVARENVALANTMAGMTESLAGCTSEHSMEHPLSGHNPHLPHGAGLIMLSKAYFTYWADRHIVDEQLIKMAKALGKEDATSPYDFVDMLVKLQKACGVADLKLSDYGIKKEDIPMYAKDAYSSMGGLFEVDPAPMPFEDCVKIYEESYR